MEKINLYDYKEYLIKTYKHECDNDEQSVLKRRNILDKKYADEYLEEIIIGTCNLISKIFEKSRDDYFGYISIPLDEAPNITYIDLNLTGGWMSDTIVKDSMDNFYSVDLLKQVFGSFFIIEPCKVEIIEETDENDNLGIVSEIPSYYLYIQCKKEIIDNVRDSFNNKSKIKIK